MFVNTGMLHIQWEELASTIPATAGLVMGKIETERLANRITQLGRAYNLREGRGNTTDALPDRFFREQTAEGAQLSRSDLDTLVKGYNQIRGAIDEHRPTGLRV